jgi:hypothetical protein
MTWYNLHYIFPMAYAKSSDQDNLVLTSVTYLPHKPKIEKLYNHGLSICS